VLKNSIVPKLILKLRQTHSNEAGEWDAVIDEDDDDFQQVEPEHFDPDGDSVME